MGVVYRGVDTVLDRPVAIKMMLGLDQLGDDVDKDEIIERFIREAKAAALIQSRFVAQVLQLGTSDEGEFYIVMELLKGQPLNKIMSRSLRAGGPIAPERVVHIGRQICRGMQAAHDLGIVHRDLKPGNIMLVSEDGDDDTVKILDFGVAKLQNEERTQGLTQAGAMLGTLAYMSPEQVAGKAVDARSDIYSLGVILYRMFTGFTIWDADSLSDIVRHQMESRPPSMLERITNANFPVQLDAVVLRCLEKKQDDRFSSMRELGDALSKALLGPTVSEVVAGVVDSTESTVAPPATAINSEGGSAVFVSAVSDLSAGAPTLDGRTLSDESDPTAATVPPQAMSGHRDTVITGDFAALQDKSTTQGGKSAANTANDDDLLFDEAAQAPTATVPPARVASLSAPSPTSSSSRTPALAAAVVAVFVIVIVIVAAVTRGGANDDDVVAVLPPITPTPPAVSSPPPVAKGDPVETPAPPQGADVVAGGEVADDQVARGEVADDKVADDKVAGGEVEPDQGARVPTKTVKTSTPTKPAASSSTSTPSSTTATTKKTTTTTAPPKKPAFQRVRTQESP